MTLAPVRCGMVVWVWVVAMVGVGVVEAAGWCEVCAVAVALGERVRPVVG